MGRAGPGIIPVRVDQQNKVSVLFVCMGNICRSPAAEGVFRHYVEQQGVAGNFHIDSAGTIDYHNGKPADPRMRAAASDRGYPLASISRQVTFEDLDEFDLIVAMDRDNLRYLEELAGGPQAHIRLLGSFLPKRPGEPGQVPEVPDPYYGGSQGFAEVLDMLERACPGIHSACRRATSGATSGVGPKQPIDYKR